MTLRPESPSRLTSAQRAERATALRSRLHAADSPAITAPAQCSFIEGEGGTGAYRPTPDRFTSCADTYWTVESTTTDAAGVSTTSYFYFEDLQWALFSATSSSWTHGLEVIGYAEGASGDLADGISAVLFSDCTTNGAGTCTATSATADPQDVTITPGSDSFFEWTESDAGPSSTAVGSDTILDYTLGVDWVITSLNPPAEALDVDGSPNGVEEGLNGRCDTIATSTDGCVDEDFIPTLTYDATANPLVEPVVQTITYAQQNLSIAWGVPPIVNPDGQELQRDMIAADQQANNRAACTNVTTTPGVTSCDEFPLESTYQGAAFQPVFFAQAVPVSANSSQGGITGQFYNGNRVTDGDSFWVKAIDENGTASW